MHLRGQIIDLPNQRIFPGVIEIADGKIVALREDCRGGPMASEAGRQFQVCRESNIR